MLHIKVSNLAIFGTICSKCATWGCLHSTCYPPPWKINGIQCVTMICKQQYLCAMELLHKLCNKGLREIANAWWWLKHDKETMPKGNVGEWNDREHHHFWSVWCKASSWSESIQWSLTSDHQFGAATDLDRPIQYWQCHF
jgi:hypothetical protein